MAEEFKIEQWDQIITKFTQTFDGLGTVLHNAEMASFTSKAPDVETGIAIYADGQFSASMPLHALQHPHDATRASNTMAESVSAAVGKR